MNSMLLAVVGISLMLAGYYTRRPAVAIGASAAWLLFGLWTLSLSTATWDIYYLEFMLGILLFIVCILEGWTLRPKVKNEEPEEDYWDEGWQNNYFERREQFQKRLPRNRVVLIARKNNKEEDDFAESGIIER